MLPEDLNFFRSFLDQARYYNRHPQVGVFRITYDNQIFLSIPKDQAVKLFRRKIAELKIPLNFRFDPSKKDPPDEQLIDYLDENFNKEVGRLFLPNKLSPLPEESQAAVSATPNLSKTKTSSHKPDSQKDQTPKPAFQLPNQNQKTTPLPDTTTETKPVKSEQAEQVDPKEVVQKINQSPVIDATKNILKNTLSWGSIQARRFLSRHPLIGASIIAAALGGATGAAFGFANGGINAALGAITPWGIGAGLIPAATSKGFGQKLLNLGASAGNTLGKLLSTPPRNQTQSAGSNNRSFEGANQAPANQGSSGFSSPFFPSTSNIRLILILLVVMLAAAAIFSFTGGLGSDQNPPESTSLANVKIDLTSLNLNNQGESVVGNGEDLKYQIRLTYSGTGEVEIDLYGTLPNGTSLSPNTEQWSFTEENTQIKYSTVTLKPQQPLTIPLTLTPSQTDFWVPLQIWGKIGTPRGLPANSSNLLPLSSESSQNWQSTKTTIFTQVDPNLAVYQQASQITGVPWEILAGIHSREANAQATGSLAGGAIIGRVDPDATRALRGACNNPNPEVGVPIPIAGGCGFRNLLDSAVWAGNHLKEKLGGSSPSNFEEAAKALSRYNGGGNSNCGRIPTPYKWCPRKLEGEDDGYVMNLFDLTHQPMYILYCADGVICNPLKIDPRPGAITVVKALQEKAL